MLFTPGVLVFDDPSFCLDGRGDRTIQEIVHQILTIVKVLHIIMLMVG